MLILFLAACLTLRGHEAGLFHVPFIMTNYFLQFGILTGFDSCTGLLYLMFFLALRFLFRLNDSILIIFSEMRLSE